MSGGSFNYLCSQELTESSGLVESMGECLRSYGYEDVAQLTEQVSAKMKEINQIQSVLKDVWKCAEWVESGDYLPPDLADAVAEFRATFQEEQKTCTSLPFSYTDDVCQLGEHDVCFSGVELTKDVGEFKAGQKFEAATIDFQDGHLTLDTAAGREHRYSFELKVGAKHEGHSCSGCGILSGKLCAQHA